MKKWCLSGLLGLAVLPAGAELMATQVATGLNAPMFATHAPGDPDGLYIALRAGGIVRLDLTNPGAGVAPFITIPNVSTNFEGGLLGLAFHPDYENNGYFYVNVTVNSTTATEIRRYTSGGGAASELDLLQFTQPQANHNGGWIGFNPVAGVGKSSELYIMTGDGGGSDDNDANHTPGSATRRTSPTTCWARCCGSMSMGMTSPQTQTATTRSRRTTRSSA